MKHKKFVSVFFLLVFLIIGVMGIYKYRDVAYINSAIESNDWSENIISEETRYDFKIGEFYKEVKYGDYENLSYEYRVRKDFRTDEKYIVTGVFDETNTSTDEPLLPYRFEEK